nr:MAG TPA: ArsC family reductase [Bacteriophage sp.]
MKDYTETEKGPGGVADVPYSKSSCPRCRAG